MYSAYYILNASVKWFYMEKVVGELNRLKILIKLLDPFFLKKNRKPLPTSDVQCALYTSLAHYPNCLHDNWPNVIFKERNFLSQQPKMLAFTWISRWFSRDKNSRGLSLLCLLRWKLMIMKPFYVGQMTFSFQNVSFKYVVTSLFVEKTIWLLHGIFLIK